LDFGLVLVVCGVYTGSTTNSVYETCAVVSLRSVSPNAATDVVSLFSPQKTDDLFSRRSLKSNG